MTELKPCPTQAERQQALDAFARLLKHMVYYTQDGDFPDGEVLEIDNDLKTVKSYLSQGAGVPKTTTKLEKYGWKCNCCQRVFTHEQKERPDGRDTGPKCPFCSAYGQYTYRYELHQGDPCNKCNTPHDEVKKGPCKAMLVVAPEYMGE